jgi:hypothetical protein
LQREIHPNRELTWPGPNCRLSFARPEGRLFLSLTQKDARLVDLFVERRRDEALRSVEQSSSLDMPAVIDYMGMDDESAALLLALERGEDMADLSELQQREVRKSMEAVHSNRQTLMLEMLQEKMRYGSSHCLTVTEPSLRPSL